MRKRGSATKAVYDMQQRRVDKERVIINEQDRTIKELKDKISKMTTLLEEHGVIVI